MFPQVNQICSFLTPPYLTGVTELLVQVNNCLHFECKNAKQDLFTTCLPSVLSHVYLICGQRELELLSGVMQQDIFQQAIKCIEHEDEQVFLAAYATTSIYNYYLCGFTELQKGKNLIKKIC